MGFASGAENVTQPEDIQTSVTSSQSTEENKIEMPFLVTENLNSTAESILAESSNISKTASGNVFNTSKAHISTEPFSFSVSFEVFQRGTTATSALTPGLSTVEKMTQLSKLSVISAVTEIFSKASEVTQTSTSTISPELNQSTISDKVTELIPTSKSSKISEVTKRFEINGVSETTQTFSITTKRTETSTVITTLEITQTPTILGTSLKLTQTTEPKTVHSDTSETNKILTRETMSLTEVREVNKTSKLSTTLALTDATSKVEKTVILSEPFAFTQFSKTSQMPLATRLFRTNNVSRTTTEFKTNDVSTIGSTFKVSQTHTKTQKSDAALNSSSKLTETSKRKLTTQIVKISKSLVTATPTSILSTSTHTAIRKPTVTESSKSTTSTRSSEVLQTATITPSKQLGFNEAELHCQKVFGGHLLSINDKSEEEFFKEKLFINSKNDANVILLGLMPGENTFTDGTIADYAAKKAFNNGLAKPMTKSCIGLFKHGIRSVSCGVLTSFGYVCKANANVVENLGDNYVSTGECKSYKKQFFYRRTPILVSGLNKTDEYCIYQIKLPKVVDNWFDEAEKFCQKAVNGHLLSVSNREEDAFLHDLLFPPFKAYREDEDTEILGLMYSSNELHDFTDGSDGSFVLQKIHFEQPKVLRAMRSSNEDYCFKMVRNYALNKDYYMALKCSELRSQWVTCRANSYQKTPVKDLSGRRDPVHRYTFSPIASCIVPYSDEYDVYARFVDVDNKRDFYCLYDITPLKSVNTSDAEFICQKDFGGHLLSISNRYELRFLSDYIFENYTTFDAQQPYELRPLGALKFRGRTQFTDKTDTDFVVKREATASSALDFQGQCYSLIRHYALYTNAIWLTKCSQQYKRFTCKTLLRDSFQVEYEIGVEDLAKNWLKRKNLSLFVIELQHSLPLQIGLAALLVFVVTVTILLVKFRSMKHFFEYDNGNQGIQLSESDGNVYDIAIADIRE